MSFVVQAIGNSKEQRKETDELFRILNLKKNINNKTLESFEDARIRSLLGVEAGVTKTDATSEDRTRNKFAQEDLALANIQSIVGINQNAFEIYQKLKSAREIEHFNTLFPKFNEVYKSLPNMNWLNFISLWQAFKNEIVKYAGPLFTPAPPVPFMHSDAFRSNYGTGKEFGELGEMEPYGDLGEQDFKSLQEIADDYELPPLRKTDKRDSRTRPSPADYVRLRKAKEQIYGPDKATEEMKYLYDSGYHLRNIEPELERVAEIITTPISERVNAPQPEAKLETVTRTGMPVNLANYARDNFGDVEQKIYESYLNPAPNRAGNGTVGEEHMADTYMKIMSKFDRLPKFDPSEKTKLLDFLDSRVSPKALHEFGRTGALQSEADIPADVKEALKLMAVLDNEITNLPKESPKQQAATPKKEVNVSVQTLNKMDDYELDELFRKVFENKFGSNPKNADRIQIPIAKDLAIPFDIKIDTEFDDLVSLQPADPAYKDDPRADSTNNVKINFIRNAANKEFKEADWNPTPQVTPAKMQITPATSPKSEGQKLYTPDAALKIVDALLRELVDFNNTGRKPGKSYAKRIHLWLPDKPEETIEQELQINLDPLINELQDVYQEVYTKTLKSESKEDTASSASSKASSGMQVLLDFYKDSDTRPKEQLVDTSSTKYKKLLNKRLEAYRENNELGSLTPAEALDEIHKLEKDFAPPNQLLRGEMSINYWKLRSLLGMWAERAPSDVIIHQFLSPQETKDNVKLEMGKYGGRYPTVTQGSGLRITKKKKSPKTKSKKKTLKIKFPM
jgi:hypothetical protein